MTEKYTVHDLNEIAGKNGFALDSRESFSRAERLLGQTSKSLFGQPKSATEAINRYAKENGIALLSMEAFIDAEEGARKQWPEVFGLPSNSTRGSNTQRVTVERLIFNEGDEGWERVTCKGILPRN